MWRPRDHERYIGGYDPDHEWESDTYRRNARDSSYFRDRGDRDDYDRGRNRRRWPL